MLKQIGVKSIAKVRNDKYYVSNVDGKLDKSVNSQNHNIVDETDFPIFDLKFCDDKYQFKGNNIVYENKNPFQDRNKNILKTKIENFYFDKSYSNNLRVQIASNIMDIQKVLSFYVDDVSYAIKNIADNNGANENKGTKNYLKEDFIGAYVFSNENYDSISKNKDKIDFCIQGLLNYKDLFGNLFEDLKIDIKNKDDKSNLYKYVYNILRCVSLARNYSFHPENKENNFLFNVNSNIQKGGKDKNQDDLFAFAKNIFGKRLKKYQSSFKNNSERDLKLLSTIYPDKSKNELLVELYNFVTYKQYKYIGVSIKNIREKIIEKYFCDGELANVQELSTIKQKINKFYDYVIWKYLEAYSDKLSEYKVKLYSVIGECSDFSISKEERIDIKEQDKLKKYDNIYNSIVDDILSNSKNNAMFNAINKYWINVARTKEDIIDISVKDFTSSKESQAEEVIDFKSEEITNFASIIYILCMFLNGNEINEFLNYLINKLESTISLIELDKIIAEKENDIEIKKEYTNPNNRIKQIKYFCDKNIASLKLVKTFVRQEKLKKVDSPSNVLFEDAINLLGTTKSKNEIWQITKDEKPNKKRIKVIRNFLKTNIIRSKQFDFILRYSSVNRCRAIMNNKNIVNYVLNQIPSEKLQRYYVRIPNSDTSICRDNIIEHLSKLNFDILVNNKEKPEYIEYLKAITGLYLNVAYLFTKKLVKINALYSMAYIALVRDIMFLSDESYKGKINHYNFDKPFNYYIKRNAIFGKKYHNKDGKSVNDKFTIGVKNDVEHLKTLSQNCWEEYLSIDNEGNKHSQDILSIMRNNIMHLTVVNKAYYYLDPKSTSILKYKNDNVSYYDIYNFVLQAIIIEDIISKKQLSGELLNYYNNLIKYGSSSRQFTRLLNSQFAYNLARYKTLTFENIFEKNTKIGLVKDEKT